MGRPLEAAYVDNNGEVELITATSYTVGASVKVGPGKMNAAYSQSSAEDMDKNPNYIGEGTISAPGEDEKYQNFWLNYIWSPANKVSFGIEVSRHSRETVGGFDGDATRIQAMAKYSF